MDPTPFDFYLEPPFMDCTNIPADLTNLDALDFDLGDLDVGEVNVDDFLNYSPSQQSQYSAVPTPAGGVGDISSSSSAASPELDLGSGGCSPVIVGVKPESDTGDVKFAGVKRKKECDEGGRSPSPSSDLASASLGDEDPRRAARLMRNRESAQLSRQRKKRYVEELEEKVKSMGAAINDLNARINYVMAENATLRQQLAGSNNMAASASPIFPPSAFPPPPGMHFPWFAGYGFRPHGVPIPKLKPQQPAPAPKAKNSAKKADSKKNDGKGKTKKVAGVSLLGMLFLILVFGTVFPLNKSVDWEGQDVNTNHDSMSVFDAKYVALNSSTEFGACGGKVGSRPCHADKNATESLPALLYVPRNGKHVKINGNLIIHAVLASEKAVAHKAARDENLQSPNESDKGTNFPVAPYLPMSREVDHGPKSYKLDQDGALPQWFREGITGPVLSSGMCTEVFQFEVSPASGHPTGIVPAASTFNSTGNNATETTATAANRGRIKNRRVMYNRAIPLPGKTLNNTDTFGGSSGSNTLTDRQPASSVVVSVLADPREAGDGDGDQRITPKSLSRIFVVVLLDGVKYVTYSCVLPFKSPSPHLVN